VASEYDWESGEGLSGIDDLAAVDAAFERGEHHLGTAVIGLAVRKPERNEVFVWDHETDSRTLISTSLESYARSALESDGDDWYR
jgi:exonuclease I